MTKEELYKKILAFENDMSKIPAPNIAWRLPVLSLLYRVHRNQKIKMEEVYNELMTTLDSMKTDLGAKDYMGWRRRVMSAFNS